jgi:hypothetical protein
MTAEITVNVVFCKYTGSTANENCEKCSFGICGLCKSEVLGLTEQCGYGVKGYYSFTEKLKGKIHD